MQRQTAQMDPFGKEAGGIFSTSPVLASVKVPNDTWEPVVANFLLKLHSECGPALGELRALDAHVLRYRSEIRRHNLAEVPREEFKVAEFPLLETILNYSRKEKARTSLSTLLMGLALELQVRSIHLDAQERLMENLRGLINRRWAGPSPWRAIQACRTLAELRQCMRDKPDDAGNLSMPGYGSGPFQALWRSDLAELCHRLLESKATLEREAAAGSDIDNEPLQARLLLGTPDEAVDAGLEEAEQVWLEPVPSGDPIPKPAKRLAAAMARSFSRTSQSPLFRGAENILPDPSARALWRDAHSGAALALERSQMPEVEALIALVLALEAGLVEHEAIQLVLGPMARPGAPALDLEAGCIRRAEVRPNGAFSPKDGAEPWLPTGGDIRFPLSSQTVKLIAGYLARRGLGAEPVTGLHDPFVFPERNLKVRRRLIAAGLRICAPNLSIPTSSFRGRLASILSSGLGPDVAQVAFGVNFGLAIPATYYVRIDAGGIWDRCVAALPSEGGPSEVPVGRPMHLIGSRAAVPRATFSPIGAQAMPVPALGRGRPSEAKLMGSWVSARNRIAMMLALVTAHRPTNALAGLTLKDFALRAGLVVLNDKECDEGHLTRVAATGGIFTSELSRYLEILRALKKSGRCSQIRGLAHQILTGQAPIFSVADEDGNASGLDVAAHFSALRAPWSGKPNLHRHALNHFLIEAGVDPEWRYGQLGWVLPGCGAFADMCPYSPVEFARGLAPHLDAWLVALGWSE